MKEIRGEKPVERGKFEYPIISQFPFLSLKFFLPGCLNQKKPPAQRSKFMNPKKISGFGRRCAPTIVINEVITPINSLK